MGSRTGQGHVQEWFSAMAKVPERPSRQSRRCMCAEHGQVDSTYAHMHHMRVQSMYTEHTQKLRGRICRLEMQRLNGACICRGVNHMPASHAQPSPQKGGFFFWAMASPGDQRCNVRGRHCPDTGLQKVPFQAGLPLPRTDSYAWIRQVGARRHCARPTSALARLPISLPLSTCSPFLAAKKPRSGATAAPAPWRGRMIAKGAISA